MSMLTIELPDSMREKVEELARQEGVTVDTFVTEILARRIAYAEMDSLVRERAQRGSPERLRELLDRAPDVPPDPHDRLDTPAE